MDMNDIKRMKRRVEPAKKPRAERANKTQQEVLDVLISEGPMTAAGVSEHMQLSRSVVSTRIHYLVGKELVTKSKPINIPGGGICYIYAPVDVPVETKKDQ